MDDVPKGQIIREMGIRGTARSLYYSHRHNIPIGRLALSKHVLTSIHPSCQVNISGRFGMGILQSSGPTDSRLMRSKLSLHEESSFTVTGDARVGPCSIIEISGDFTMGNSFINGHSRITCFDEISIGDGCAIAWNVEMLDEDRHNLFISGERAERSAPIRIQDNVWIGHDVTIKKGVTVHNGAIVASDSVVTKDVEPGTLVAGCPAKVIYDDVSWNT